MVANNSERKRAIAAFVLYLVSLVYFLFFAQEMGRTADRQYRYNLTLFCEIKRFINNIDYLGWKSVAINVLGNILAFVPFGYFVPKISEKRRMGVIFVTVLSFEFSLIVEVIQLITRLGCFDVDDLLLNTAGGFIGYICFYFMYRRQQKRVTKKKA